MEHLGNSALLGGCLALITVRPFFPAPAFPPPPTPPSLLAAPKMIFHSPLELVNIRRFDEAVVIGAALSLSSSAFVLKILQASEQRRGNRAGVPGFRGIGTLHGQRRRGVRVRGNHAQRLR